MTGDIIRLIRLAIAASTLMLLGRLWFVQIVHDRPFSHVGVEHFVEYQSEHVRMVTWVVALPMLIEAVTSVDLPESLFCVESRISLLAELWLVSFI
jgi:hypothetical protein